MTREGEQPWRYRVKVVECNNEDLLFRTAAMLRAYIDESYIGNKEGILLGCVVASTLNFSFFDKSWRKTLREFGVNYYHGAELYNYNKQYRGWNKNQIIEFSNRLEEVVERRLKLMFSVYLDVSRFKNEYLKSGNTAKERGQLGSDYQLVFRYALIQIMTEIENYFPSYTEKIQVYVEDGGASQKGLIDIFNHMKFLSLSNRTNVQLDKIRFAGKMVPGLQAADLVAYAAQKYEKNLENYVNRTPYESYTEAQRITGKKVPFFRHEIQEGDFLAMKEAVLEQHTFFKRMKRWEKKNDARVKF
ncbi:MAG: DUF3800 domain-containing protein [Maricaulaceae bacterium]